MGRAPYKSAKEGVGAILSVSTFNHRGAFVSCMLDSICQIIGQLIMYNKAVSLLKSSPDCTQHSGWQHVNVSVV